MSLHIIRRGFFSSHTMVAACLIAALCPRTPAQVLDTGALPAAGVEAEQISMYVREVFQDRAGNYWFGTNGDGVARYDGNSLEYISLAEGLAGSAIRGILQDADGAMWFATNRGVSRYLGGAFTNYTEADGLSDDSIWSMMRDRSGTIWVGTHTGVCRLDGKSFKPFPLPRVEVENPSSRFSPLVVFAMYEDQAGGLWFGTDGEGVHRYDGTSFTSYTEKDGLAGNQVRSIAGDRHGRIWIGTNGGGVSRFDGGASQNYTENDGLNNNRIYEILEDRAGQMWFSTLGAGASRYDGTSFTAFGAGQGLTVNDHPCPCGSGRKHKHCHGPNKGAHVQEFFEDKDGNLWLGCSGGLFRFDGESFINVTRDGPWPDNTGGPPQKPISLEGWASETFALPPGFAPDLPTGTESLRFAPGWRDPDSENFWSYAFVMSIDEPAPDAARVGELLESYYNGLMSVFASNKDKGDSIKPARVEVERTGPGLFEAKMQLIDAFATFEPVEIRVLIETVADSDGHSSVRIQVSRQPKEHKIWRSLDAAIKSIQSQADLLGALKERSAYASLDKQSVETLARIAETHWPAQFTGFTYQHVEHFSAGGMSHWMSIWLHDKTGLEFVLLPGGKFQMGSPAGEANRNENEIQHWVTLDPLLIARTECTRGAWAKLAKAAGVNSDPSFFDGSDQQPVESVSLEEVKKWCREAHLTLPTEAQWEYMCRAGTKTTWTMGDDKTDLARFANLGSADCPQDWIDHPLGITEPWHDGYGDELAPAGSFDPNSFGLFDVHGNVRELCRGDFIGYEVQVENGTGLRPGISGVRLARGGSFNNTAIVARSAKRLKNIAPTHRMVGFRPSLDLPF